EDGIRDLTVTGVQTCALPIWITLKIMRIPGLRHSAEQVGGVVFFGRMLDKIRLHAQGKLPPDYKHGAGTDTRVCRFLRVEYPARSEERRVGKECRSRMLVGS